MKKITSVLFFLVPLLGISQNAEQKIQAYLDANRAKQGLSAQDVSDWVVDGKLNSESTGIDNFFVKQRYNGTEVFHSTSNFWIKNGEVIQVAGENFVANLSQKINAVNPQLSAIQAISAAASALGLPVRDHSILATLSPKSFSISNGEQEPITAQLVYQSTPEGQLRLAWDLTIETAGHDHLWSVRIDAITGSMLEKDDMVISCNFDAPAKTASISVADNHAFTTNFFKSQQSMMEIQSGSYRVIPLGTESPAFGPRQLVATPHDPIASPYGWHDSNGAAGNEYTITRGNNVFASEDRNGNDGTGASPNGGAGLLFDFPYGGNSVTADTYTSASTTNLFYMNNIMHDVWYRYGFNEVNGNFQQNNYGNGGTSSLFGDYVIADSQDGAELTTPNLNNANFSTPVDGTRPRMQMYLWNVPPRFFFITAPSALAGGYQAVDNAFNPGHVDIPLAPAMLQTQLVLYQDASAITNEACVLPANAAQLAGKIVLIRRGNCDFVLKVKNAQDAGAVAVIMCDNLPNQLVNMAGADATITIPAVFVTKEMGDALIAAMQSGPVTVKLQAPVGDPFVNADGDFDNGIISHEYGHGISTRLTGGPANSSCLFNAEAMGEGWSDWFALMMQLKAGDVGSMPKGIAAYASNQPIENGGGIRSLPYSTDMSVNNKTLANSNSTSDNYRYDIGEVWASMLWDLTWAYINKYGFDPNIYSGTGGNNKVMRLVLDGLKLQPCNPGFVSARNALIAADQATTGGADFCMIWEVFARRGLGVNASSGSTSNSNDQVADFTEPSPGPNCTLSVDQFHNDQGIRIYPNPSNGMVNVRINNFSGKVNIQVVDVNGRVVYQAPNTDFNIEQSLNLSHLQTGMYVVKVSGDNLNFSKKLILN